MSFKQGLKVHHYKLTEKIPIKDMPLPEQVFIPLSQHIGKPAVPIVKVGDNVKTGQKIADLEGFVSSAVHSSVTGVVKDIFNYFSPYGTSVKSILISDIKEDVHEYGSNKYSEYYRFSSQDLIDVIKESGIVGLGGAGFPTHVKLSIPPAKEIDTILVNACECEPFLTVDHRLLIENVSDIVNGLKVVMYIVKADEAFICIEDNKPDAIKLFRQELAKHPNISLKVMPSQYPQGSEKFLIYNTLKRRVPSKGLPLDVGCLVNNVATLCAIRDAVFIGKSLFDKVITVSGDNIEEPGNIRVRVGTILKDVLDFCKWNGSASKVVLGGPMMGIAQSSLEVSVLKTTSGILVFDEVTTYDQANIDDCIKCGKCIGVCPNDLIPNLINIYTLKKKYKNLKNLNVSDCVECGSCAYLCPAKIPLVQGLKMAKSLE